MLLVSECIARAALDRKESRGGHTRDDFPLTEPEWGKLNVLCRLNKKGTGVEVFHQDLPVDAGRAEDAVRGRPLMGYDLSMRIWRGDDTGGDLVDFTVPVEEGEVVLDAIHRVQATQAGDLAVRWNCKAGKCGSCSAEINGRPRLMCMTRLSMFEPTETITVTPMRTFPVMRDLVTDVSFNYEKAKQVPAFTPPADLAPGEYRMQQVDVERSQEFRKCIECFLCQNICHVIRDHEENKPAYAGPRFFIRYAELDMHPLDTIDRKQMLQAEQGLGHCNITKCCTEVCPEHIKITDNAIIPMKERVVDVRFDPWTKVTRRKHSPEQERTPAGGRSHRPPPPTVATTTAPAPRPQPASREPAAAVDVHASSDIAAADRAVASRAIYRRTLQSLHGVAELILAGTQRRANRSIKLDRHRRWIRDRPVAAAALVACGAWHAPRRRRQRSRTTARGHVRRPRRVRRRRLRAAGRCISTRERSNGHRPVADQSEGRRRIAGCAARGRPRLPGVCGRTRAR